MESQITDNQCLLQKSKEVNYLLHCIHALYVKKIKKLRYFKVPSNH